MITPRHQPSSDEPPMYLQRPSSARSQDVSHVLARTFREYFTRDAVPPDTVKYLHTSRGGDDEYHEKYVLALKQVQEERERRMAEAAMLERHIMQAQARAMSADERALNRAASSASSFPDLGLPPVRTHFRSCIDTALLKKHNLITPDDFAIEEPPLVPPPSAPNVPSYARDTQSSNKKKDDVSHWETPLPSPRGSIASGHILSESETVFSESGVLPPIESGDSSYRDMWKQQVSAEEREMNRVGIANQQAKVDYLKNPRHIPPSAAGGERGLLKQQKKKAKEIGIKPKAEKECTKEPSVVFVASPPVVTFTSYEVGQVYEIPLELKNVTTVLRPVRIVPPKSQFFSVGLGQFPGEQGLVAPGMSCKYMVRFAPDSYDDYDDGISIQTQSSTPLVVRLEGRRPPPKLSLPPTIDVGQALIGGVKIGQFHVKNEGGSGRFCIVPKSAWPPVNFKSVVSSGTVSIPPFEVRPSVFELKGGQKMMLEILFAPTEKKTYDQEIAITCDNCDVKYFTIRGETETAAVELVSVEGGLSEAKPGELCDLTAQHLIKFENLNPYTYLQKSVSVQNLTNVELPFDWIIVKPYIKVRVPDTVDDEPEPPSEREELELPSEREELEPLSERDEREEPEPPSERELPDPSSEGEQDQEPSNERVQEQEPSNETVQKQEPSVERIQEPEPPTERVQDIETMFSIEPESGILPPSGKTKFTLTYAPPVVGAAHNAFHLVLRNIPRVVPPPEPVEKQPSQVDLKRSLSRENSLMKNNSRENTRMSENMISSREPLIEDMTALEFEVKGECEPLSVILQPYALTFPGQIMVETLVKRQFRMINNSLSAILFQWEHHSSSYILEVEPPIGELGPQCEMDLELSMSASEPCHISHTLNCLVHHLGEPLMLHIEADIKGPEITIEESDVNFGLVRLGETARATLTLSNNCRVPAKWTIREAPTHQDGQQDILPESEFMFSPDTGELRPLDSIYVTITYKPRAVASLRTVFQIQVEDGRECAVVVQAEVQEPQVCLMSCEMTLDQVFLDVPVCHQVVLLNQTLLSTTFEWGQLEGTDASRCSVQLDPNSGHLAPREKLEISLYFTAHSMGELKDLYLPVQVAGMSKPLYLALHTDVNGLSVTYSTPQPLDSNISPQPEEEIKDPCVDFGAEVPLGLIVKRFLHIKNNSAITAPFSLNVEYFFTKPPTPPERRPDGHMPNKSQRRALLGRTQNLADPLSKTPAKAQSELCKTMLVEGKGAAFSISPASGVLEPFGEQVIEVAAFSDMWGEYTDRITCEVEKLDLVFIPVKMTVVGCPLHFQMVSAQPTQVPILRCGTHVSGVAPVLRQMRINNPCPFDVRLDWQVFNKDPEDQQLLDLVLSYGTAFPLRDENGEEILPAEEAISRQPTISEARTPTPFCETQPKIITVTLREHGGKMSNNPYQIQPDQTVIPAHGNSCINVSFTPLAASDVNNDVDCLGFALGYISLKDKVSYVDNKVSRAQGYGMSPLRLEMTAQVKPALLTIECGDDEGMRYRAAASDLHDNGQLIPQRLKMCHATLTNSTKTPLVFRLLTTEPFNIVQLDSATQKPIAQLLQTNMTTLRPRENAGVQVGFQLTMDLLEYLDVLDGSEYEGVEVEEKDLERRIHFRQDLVIEFNNSSTQRLPLYATLIVPTLVLSRETVDFGTCLVGQQRELQILLSNPTASASYWQCSQERRSETSSDDTFRITPSSGMLDAHVTHISNSKTLLKVFFTAKHNEVYEAVYTFQGALGEQPRHLVVKGEGSYDGKYEALVNI